jgi:hypothetical protein
MASPIDYNQIFNDFSYAGDKEFLLDIISQIEDKTQIIPTLESFFPKPEGWTPPPMTSSMSSSITAPLFPPNTQFLGSFPLSSIQFMPMQSMPLHSMPIQSMHLPSMTQLLQEAILTLNNIPEGENSDSLSQKDKRLLTKVIKNRCRNVNCYSCKYTHEFYSFASEKYKDEFVLLFDELISEFIGDRFLFTNINLERLLKKGISMKKTKSYKKIYDKYGDHVSDHLLNCLHNKINILILQSMDHVVPQIIEMLRDQEADVEYALLFGLPEYELDEFLPKEKRKGMSEDLIEQFKSKLTIIDKKEMTDKCSICLEEFNSEENDSEVVELLCKHKFHWNCIKEMLKINATCPLCKKNLKEED